MPVTLKGQRYVTSNDHAALARAIANELPTFDYAQTRAWYDSLAALVTAKKVEPSALALLGLNDRFFLLTHLLGRRDALHPWLFARCREVEADPDGHLDLWAREHYKSTIITFAGVIQAVLIDPELTVCIFSFRKANAQAFLRQIKQELETNLLLRRLYPDVLWDDPATEAPVWSISDGIVVRRSGNPKEATVQASGLVDGMPTGGHFGLRVYDDVVTNTSVTNPEMVQKTTEAVELSDNLGAGDNRAWFIGTRYTFADTYGVMLERNMLVPRIYPATHDGKVTGKPVFFSAEKWASKLKNQRSTLAAQMLQNPVAGQENTFRAEWLRSYEVRPYTLNVYIMCDPAKGKSAKSDRTAIAVIGIDAAGNKYLLDGYRHRMSLSERWDALKQLYWKWKGEPGVQNVRVGYERYGMQTDLEYIEERMRAERNSFPIDELNWANDSASQSKKARVERLEPDVRLARFYLPAMIHEQGQSPGVWRVDAERNHLEIKPLVGPTKQQARAKASGQGNLIAKAIRRLDENDRVYDLTRALIEEMMFFPFAPKDDLIDACSRIYDMEPVAPIFMERFDASEHEGYIDS